MDTANHTTATIVQATWTFAPIFTLVVMITAVVSNGLVLSAFVRNSHLRTSFSVYLMSLLVANLLNTLTQYPLDVASSLFSTGNMGDRLCDMYIYSNYILSAGTMTSHVLIALNRLWAMTYPLSYKNNHTRKTAVFICAGMWTYIHVLLLPPIIMDSLYFRLPLETSGCGINLQAQSTCMTIMQLLVSDGPEVFILVSYPFILYKARSYRRIRLPLMTAQSERIKNAAERMAVANSERNSKAAVNFVEGRRHTSRALILVTLLTGSIIICWTPVWIDFTLPLFTNFNHPVFSTVALALYGLQNTMDAIVFTIAFPELRAAVLFRH